MKRLVNRFGKLITASFIVMAIGIIVFFLVIPLYHYFGIDTDIIGLIIFAIGLDLCLIGIIHRNKTRGWKLAVLVIIAAALCLPVLFLIISLIYYLITGNPLGG